MMYRCLAWVAFLAAAGVPCAAMGGQSQSLWIDELNARDRVEVRTAEYQFRFDLVDPSTGEALVALSRDGVNYGPADRVFLLGSTQGRHAEGLTFVRMGRIDVGRRLELAVRTMAPENRRLTAPIESIDVTAGGAVVLP